MTATRPRLKTSTGCDQCRQRKKKCDESRPTCSACSRWRFDCTWKGGPPSKNSFQQPGVKIILPLIGQQKKSNLLPSPPVQDLSDEGGRLSVISSRTLKQSAVDIALQQFLRGYSFLTNRTTSSIDPLYRSAESLHISSLQDISSDGLRQALEAISLAYMGTQKGDSEVLAGAQRSYTTAIKTLREILENPQEFQVNKVLAAIRLCTGYELLTCDDPRTAGWAFHMKGQATLARSLLAKLQEGDQTDRDLFYESLLSIAVVNGYARAPMPFSVGELEEIVTDERDFEGTLAVLSVRVNEIRREADLLTRRDVSPEALRSCGEAIKKAKRLSRDLQSWEENMEIHKPFEVIQAPEEASLSEDAVVNAEYLSRSLHHYRSLHDANLYNQARCWLIYTHSAIVQLGFWRHVQQSSSVYEWPATALDFNIIQSAVDGICATVPYYLGIFGRTQHFSERLARQVSCWGGGHASLWFWLATAVGVESIHKTQHDWILGRLAFIGDKLGHKWAKFISKNPPSDVILGSNMSTRTRSMYKIIPGWPQVDVDATHLPSVPILDTSSRRVHVGAAVL